VGLHDTVQFQISDTLRYQQIKGYCLSQMCYCH